MAKLASLLRSVYDVKFLTNIIVKHEGKWKYSGAASGWTLYLFDLADTWKAHNLGVEAVSNVKLDTKTVEESALEMCRVEMGYVNYKCVGVPKFAKVKTNGGGNFGIGLNNLHLGFETSGSTFRHFISDEGFKNMLDNVYPTRQEAFDQIKADITQFAGRAFSKEFALIRTGMTTLQLHYRGYPIGECSLNGPTIDTVQLYPSKSHLTRKVMQEAGFLHVSTYSN